MSRTSLFSSPLLVGFDGLERLLERAAQATNDGYPPYDIEQLAPDRMRITLAVAGFSEAELSITVEAKQLVIRGKQSDDRSERLFLHRGIAARQFHRSFVLADDLEVAGAALEKGLLHIDVDRLSPDTVVRKVDIRTASGDG